MHREGIDPDNVQPKDILCDYCGGAAWADGEPCVEGHQGSVICGQCLTKAYQDIVINQLTVTTEDTCKMCLEHRDETVWLGGIEPVAPICLRCVKQSSAILHKSKHWDWTKPTPD